MKNKLIICIMLLLPVWITAQIDHQNVYITNSCAGEKVKKRIHFSEYGDKASTFYFKGSNIKGLKAFIDGNEIDTISEINIKENKDVFIDIEFEITNKMQQPEVYYSLETDDGIRRSSIPIHLSTYTVNSRQNYIQTHNACTEYVYWAFPFYATQTDIFLHDITDGNPVLIKSFTYYCCFGGNIIKMPRDTKGKFAVSVSGCYSSDAFTFEVNTMANH